MATLGGCLPEAATDSGRQVTQLYTWFMIAAAGVFVIVVGLLAWTIVRYRGQPGRDVPMPYPITGNIPLEVAWWALPAVLVAVLAVFTFIVLNEVDARADDPEVTVQVTGYQWGWEFIYPESGVVVNGSAVNPATILLPTDRTIAFEIRSEDVIHSFNIPAFLIKRDALPTRTNRFDVVIVEEGTYGGQCGEFCGLLHARQLFEIDAVAPAIFDDWLADQAADAAGAADAGSVTRARATTP